MNFFNKKNTSPLLILRGAGELAKLDSDVMFGQFINSILSENYSG